MVGAASATNSVHIVLNVVGKVKVDNVLDARDVEAPGGDVCGNHDIALARLKLLDYR